MDVANFSDMSAEDILTLIETAQSALDDKIAAEKAAIEERQTKLVELETRRGGKVSAPKAKPAAAAPRARPAPVAAHNPAEQPALQA